jgi:hypothetical protein
MTTWEERFTARRPVEPRLELLEMCWRFVGPSRKVFECGVYRTDISLEVRAGYGPEDLVRSERAVEIGSARLIAAEWRNAVLAKGGFTELPADDGSPQ